MFTELMDPAAARLQDLRDQQAEFAIAQYGYGGAGRDPHLIEDFAGGRHRLRERRDVRFHGIGHDAEIVFGKNEEFAERAGLVDDAENCALRAVAFESASAPGAAAAGEVDFPHDAASDEGVGIRFDDFPHEFMARRAGEAVISALELEVGIADSAGQKTDQRKAFGPGRARDFPHLHPARFDVN